MFWLSYHGTCEGSVLVSSTPTAGTPTAATPRSRPRLEGGAWLRLFGAHVGRVGAHDDDRVELPELPVEGAQQAPADTAEQLAVDELPAAHELPAGEHAEGFDQLHVDRRLRGRVVGPGRRGGDAGQVEGLAHGHDRREAPPAWVTAPRTSPSTLSEAPPRKTRPTVRPCSRPWTASG